MAGCASSIRETKARVEQPVQTVQLASANDSRISVKAARADLDSLYRSLQSAHYNLYVYRPKSQYDVYFQEVSSRLSGSMSRLDLIREFQPFLAFGNIGHARIEFPVAEYIRAAQDGGTVLPFDIRIDGERVFVSYSHLGAGSLIQPGVELLEFGGKPISEVVARASRYVSGERPYMVNAQLERFFPRWLWLAEGNLSAVNVSGRNAGGARFSEIIKGLPIREIEPLKSEWTEALSAREVRIIDQSTAYLRPGAFYNLDGGDSMDLGSFEKFINDAFVKIKVAKSQALIVDLRDNPGGDNSFSDLMVAWFANRPFRFSNSFSIKVSAEIRQNFEKQLRESTSEKSIVAEMQSAIKGKAVGQIVQFELPIVEARKDRFEGRVFVIVNRHSYSNAASVAGMIQDYGFAKIFGEETADLPTSHASSAQFALPNSAIIVTYPKAYFIRPNGDRSLRGVVPDYPIGQRFFKEGHQSVLDEVLKIIKAEGR